MVQQNALLSVYHKTETFFNCARSLAKAGVTLYASGGTAAKLAEAGIAVIDIQTIVGEKVMDGRVSTLSREIHAGLLARPGVETDLEALEKMGAPFFDIVYVDMYPLAEEIAKPDATEESVTRETDIGGPTMIRSAAKGRRIILTDELQLRAITDMIASGEEGASPETRRRLAANGEWTVAQYVATSAVYLSDGAYDAVFGELVGPCKYGENPYMTPAGLYRTDDEDPLALHRFTAVEGDERSFINLTDADCLLQVLTHIAAGFDLNFNEVLPLMAVGVKHGNACGAAVGADPVEVIRRMVAGDKRAIFGGVVMTNFPVTREVAEALVEKAEDDPPRLFDGVFAPAFASDATEVLKRYQGKCRMMANPALAVLDADSLDAAPRIRPVRGGYLRQPNYTFILRLDESEVYGAELTGQQERDIVLAWAVGCVSNSNTVTLVKDGQLIGNGVGQQDRVGAAELAIKRALDAGHETAYAVAWSDSFFPAPDGPTVLGEAGLTAIFASSGSKRDADTIATCERHRVTLLTQPDTVVRGFAKH
jgi:phosphoribosylaminoimidazolecarboxamide formyltransferase/IMP cyclohydrolase